MKKTILATALTVASVTATAEPVGYFTGGLGFIKYKEDGLSAANITALDIGFGSQINDYLAIGGKFLIGVAEGTVDVYGVDVDVDLDYSYTLEVKPTFPVSETVNLYAVLGFTSGKVTASAGGFEASDSDSGLTYGVGVNKKLDNNFALRFEYAKYLELEAADISGFNIGIQKNFK